MFNSFSTLRTMQTGCRCILKHLRRLNYFVYNPFLYTCFFKQEILQNKLYYRYNFYLPKYFVTTSSVPSKKKSVSNIEDLKNYINEEKQFYLKLVANILNNIKFDSLSSEDARLLFTCCGNSVADSSKQARDKICQEIYKNLLDCNKLDLNISHTYIEICTENSVVLNCKEFLSQVKFEPNQKTYKLLLDNVCQKADIVQALELLETMKIKGISVNEEIFNDLVLAHTIQGGLKSGEIVLRTMKTAQIPETTATKYSVLKGILQRGNSEDIDQVLERYPIDLTEGQVLELLEIVGLGGNISWLNKIKHMYSNIDITRDYINALEKICVHLVHMDKSEYAMTIYEEFVDPEKDQNYGFFILKEMLHCDVDIERTITLCKHLHDNNLNNYALQHLTELALRHNYTEASWRLLENMPVLRPHFFWPLLLDANRKQGEIGIFNVLQKMVDLGVEINWETMHTYVLPVCNTDNLKLTITKLKNLKVTAKDAVNSLLIVLLQNNKVKQAAELCSTYNVNIFGEKLLRLFSSSWITSKDTNSVVVLLQRYCESNHTKKDFVGDFLTETLNSCTSNNDFIEYAKLLELINKKKLRINTATADNLHNLTSSKCKDSEVCEKIKDGIDKLMDFGLNPEPAYIPHPQNMTIDELECHLLELQEKNMETRGVLRKLIQQHANLGHLDRVNELREQFLFAGYEETVGMKSSLMHNYIKKECLEQALSIYNNIKLTSPHFKIDNFKVIDLATLLVKEEKYGEAMDILKIETSKKLFAGSGIEKNCRQLLDSYKNAEEQLKMFEFLVEYGYCKPTNIIFGPLVRIHLKKDLQKGVNTYLNCASDYKCTPLQLELIKELLKEQNDSLLQSVIKATEKVHGVVSTRTVLIAALAENGQEKALQKLFVANKLNIKEELQKRCDRWVQEGKVEAMQTLARVCERLSQEVFNVNIIYNCIMRTYSLNNDYKSALEFYEQLLEKDIFIDKQLEVQLTKLKKNCNLKEVINNI
ncbi:leucine-rich PPR motif-containing protein, mitochondrial [Anoplophora glabripennis]|nr:leucine-rich PPR motif-containing protein, mitochondrial [Anoplophora glabripennis]